MEKQMSSRKIPKLTLLKNWLGSGTRTTSLISKTSWKRSPNQSLRRITVRVHLQPKEIEAVKEIAKSKGIDSSGLIRQWVLDKIQVS